MEHNFISPFSMFRDCFGPNVLDYCTMESYESQFLKIYDESPFLISMNEKFTDLLDAPHRNASSNCKEMEA